MKGEFTDGKPHGTGSEHTAAGEEYVGKYVDGRRHGQGAVTFADGHR